MIRKSELNENDYKEFLIFLYFGKGSCYIDNCIKRAYLDFNRTLHGIDELKQKQMLISDANLFLKEELIKLQIGKYNIDLSAKTKKVLYNAILYSNFIGF